MSASADPELSTEVRLTLTVGIVASAVLLLIGLLLVVLAGPADILAAPQRIGLGALPGDLGRGDGDAFILLGTLVLVFTPIVRVLVSFAHFLESRDRAFTLITAFVLAILAVSVAIGVSP